jgi:hypothetical protein
MQRKLTVSICCCLVTRMQGKIMTQKIADRCFANVAQFEYLGMIVTNQILFRRKL